MLWGDETAREGGDGPGIGDEGGGGGKDGGGSRGGGVGRMCLKDGGDPLSLNRAGWTIVNDVRSRTWSLGGGGSGGGLG